MEEKCCHCKSRPRLPGMTSCQFCRDSAKRSAARKKQYNLDHNLCSHCGKNIPEPGYRNCRKCLDKFKQQPTTPEQQVKNNIRAKHWRSKRREQDICIRCGKKPPRPNKTSCEDCYQKSKEDYAKQKAEFRHDTQRRKQAGICTRCGKYKVQPGSSNCENCKAKIREKHRLTRYSGNMLSVLERDNQTCQLCGGKKYIHVHHIDGNGTTSEHPNDDPSNLIVLCNLCHYSITNLRRGPVNLEKLIFLLTSYPVKD